MTSLARTANWWKFLAVGACALSAVVITLNIIGEVSDTWWLPMMILLFGSVVTLVTGLLMGIAHLSSRRPS